MLDILNIYHSIEI